MAKTELGIALNTAFCTKIEERIDNVLVCPNSNCISHAEPVSSSFAVRKRANDIALKCKYCEKEFSHNVVLAN